MRLVHKILVLGVIFVILMSMFSCKGKTQEKLIIGTSAEYPPFEYKEGGKFVGFDIEIAQAIADKLGLTLEVVDMSFDSLVPSLTANKIDVAIAAMTINADREKVVKFSVPYYMTNQALLAPKDTKLVITSAEDITKYKVGVQNGTTGQTWIDENLITPGKMKKDALKKYDTNIEAVTDLINGNIDLVIIDDVVAKGYEKAKNVKSIFLIETNESYGIAFPKDSPKYEKINKALQEVMASPKWQELLDKYIIGKIQ